MHPRVCRESPSPECLPRRRGGVSKVPNSGRVFKERSRQTSHREDKREEAIVARVG